VRRRAAAACDHAAPIRLTCRQATALGGQARKGEKREPIVYKDALTYAETKEHGQEQGFAFRGWRIMSLHNFAKTANSYVSVLLRRRRPQPALYDPLVCNA